MLFKYKKESIARLFSFAIDSQVSPCLTVYRVPPMQVVFGLEVTLLFLLGYLNFKS